MKKAPAGTRLLNQGLKFQAIHPSHPSILSIHPIHPGIFIKKCTLKCDIKIGQNWSLVGAFGKMIDAFCMKFRGASLKEGVWGVIVPPGVSFYTKMCVQIQVRQVRREKHPSDEYEKVTFQQKNKLFPKDAESDALHSQTHNKTKKQHIH